MIQDLTLGLFGVFLGFFVAPVLNGEKPDSVFTPNLIAIYSLMLHGVRLTVSAAKMKTPSM